MKREKNEERADTFPYSIRVRIGEEMFHDIYNYSKENHVTTSETVRRALRVMFYQKSLAKNRKKNG